MEDRITLRQGLEKFREEYKNHLSHNKNSVSNEADAFFTSHDVVHVIFGCDISLSGEGSVKIWTIFGTTLGFWQHIIGYQEASAFKLSKNFTLTHVAKNIFKLLSSIPIIIIRAKQMHKLWPWKEFEPYLDTPIAEIRKQYNIIVLS